MDAYPSNRLAFEEAKRGRQGFVSKEKFADQNKLENAQDKSSSLVDSTFKLAKNVADENNNGGIENSVAPTVKMVPLVRVLPVTKSRGLL